MRKRVLIDMDGVLADFEHALYSRFPDVKDLNDTDGKADHLRTELGVTLDRDKSTKSQMIDFLITNKYRDIFEDLRPIPGAVEAFKFLCQHYEVFILSTPMWILPESYTAKRKWVEHWLGDAAYKKLILSHNKSIVQGDYLIDDRIKNGVAEFPGEHIHFGQPEFPNWDKVLEYLVIKDELNIQ
jgi:5'-nucleotidase